jgi:hypothetical protein
MLDMPVRMCIKSLDLSLDVISTHHVIKIPLLA